MTETDTSKATPRPWMVGAIWGRTTRRVPIYPETPTLDQLVVAEARGGNPEANAALIVRAVNAYDAMREALEAVEWVVDSESTSFLRCSWCGAGCWYGTEPPPHKSDCKRQAALAAAKGKEAPR